MKHRFSLFALVPLAILGLCIVGCSSDDDDPVTPPAPERFTIGGELTGSAGDVVVTLNGEENLQLVVDGEFTFTTEIEDGNDYVVTVTVAPPDQACTVENGQGTVDGADVTDVAVTCTANPPEPEFFTIGGEITGSAGNVVVTLNGEENLQLVVDGEFTFTTEIEDGNDYDVTVTLDPLGQVCTVENGQGTVDGADVTDVAVTCGPNPPGPYSIGGTVSGMGAGELVLQQGSGIDFKTIRKDGEYTFRTAYPDLFAYIVTVSNQPPGPEVCVVLNNRGIIDGADVTNIDVVCAVP